MDLEEIIFNPISSTFLKWLRIKVVSWRHDFQPGIANGLGLFDCIFWLHHIQALANVTMATIACNEVCRESR
jgi:hypothetical protein